jgi:thioesterase domain-containing protein
MNLPRRVRDDLAEVPAGKRIDHVARTALRWSKAAGGLRVEASNMFDLNRGDADFRKLFESNIRAIREYRATPLRAPVLLIRSKRQHLANLALDATLGWRDFVNGDVRIRVVPGNHRTMATEPLVRELAQTLRAELDAAQHVR